MENVTKHPAATLEIAASFTDNINTQGGYKQSDSSAIAKGFMRYHAQTTAESLAENVCQSVYVAVGVYELNLLEVSLVKTPSTSVSLQFI